jgi:hypothetical protein
MKPFLPAPHISGLFLDPFRQQLAVHADRCLSIDGCLALLAGPLAN